MSEPGLFPDKLPSEHLDPARELDAEHIRQRLGKESVYASIIDQTYSPANLQEGYLSQIQVLLEIEEMYIQEGGRDKNQTPVTEKLKNRAEMLDRYEEVIPSIERAIAHVQNISENCCSLEDAGLCRSLRPASMGQGAEISFEHNVGSHFEDVESARAEPRVNDLVAVIRDKKRIFEIFPFAGMLRVFDAPVPDVRDIAKPKGLAAAIREKTYFDSMYLDLWAEYLGAVNQKVLGGYGIDADRNILDRESLNSIQVKAIKKL